MRLFKSGKKIKSGFKDELVNGFKIEFHSEKRLELVLVVQEPSSMAESFKKKNS